MNKDLGQKLFGKDYKKISKPLNKSGGYFYSIFYGDFPMNFYKASPIDLMPEHNFSFNTLPFYNRTREGQGIPKINLFPVIKKEMYEKRFKK